jgi:hypothetical protein
MSNKKTPTQKYIDEALERFNDKIKTTTVKNSTFQGVVYDAKAVDAIETIADGLLENAKALGKLAEVLKSSNVEIECLLKLEQPK